MKPARSLLVAAVASLAMVPPALAQDFSSYATNIGMATSQSHAMADVYRDVYGRGQGHGSSRGANSGAVRGGPLPGRGPLLAARGPVLPVPAAVSRLQYRPSPAATKTALDAYIARARRTNPKDADVAYRELSRHDISRIYRDIVGPFGLRDGNAADSFTALTVLGWMITNGAGDPSPDMVRAARAQFAPALASNPVIGGNPLVSGEEYKLTFVILFSSWQSARKTGGLDQFSAGVARMFAQNGMDLRGLALTPGGFQPRKG